MSSITVSSLVLGSLTVEVDGSDASLALSVLGTAPASLTIELGTPGAQGNAATIAVGTTTTLNPGESATVVNVGTSSAATFNFGIPKGEQGVQGIQGSPGNAATVSVGSTTTGAAGSSASVTNSGTSSAAVLQFTIPRGDTGATGATGATGPAGPGVATGGTTGQYLQKASGTNYDTTWATIVPGDRYLTTSTTSLTVGNGTKSLTIGTGLSYSPTQDVTIALTSDPTLHHMHAQVTSYNSGTGALTVDVQNHTGSGTYSSWTVNVGGIIPLESVAWGDVTGTLADQVDLQTALDSKLAKASNLSDLANASTARTNLGLGTAAVEPATKLVPAGGTTGQVLTKLSNSDWDDAWATPSGGGGGVDIQTFGTSTTSGTFTWTKPANAKWVHVYLFGAGAGGGSGAVQATTSSRYGGGAGSGGGFCSQAISANALGSTETVVVGAGGQGGAAVTTNSTNGNAGTAGGASSFSFYRAIGGSNGTGGTTTSGTPGGNSASYNYMNVVSAGSGGAGSNIAGSSAQSFVTGVTATGGGGGGGAAANVLTTATGGNGGSLNSGTILTATVAGGLGSSPPTAPTNGTSSTNQLLIVGTGGGGSGYRNGFSSPAAANGGWPSGGGGGSGSADNGFTVGKGGNGANGLVVVITYT
jgi:hypothetical protein